MTSRGPSQRGGNSTRGGRGGHSDAPARPKKEAILDLSKYEDKTITVKFNGGREVRGTLKGWDQLMNLVLDEGVEVVSGEFDWRVERIDGWIICGGRHGVHANIEAREICSVVEDG